MEASHRKRLHELLVVRAPVFLHEGQSSHYESPMQRAKSSVCFGDSCGYRTPIWRNASRTENLLIPPSTFTLCMETQLEPRWMTKGSDIRTIRLQNTLPYKIDSNKQRALLRGLKHALRGHCYILLNSRCSLSKTRRLSSILIVHCRKGACYRPWNH